METVKILEGLENFRDILNQCDGKTKYAGLNSIDHMLKAYELREVDPHMAFFRAICAEEEAATSLINSIKSQNILAVRVLMSARMPTKLP